jgi:hypothetical protein
MSSIGWREAIAEVNERLGIKPPPRPSPSEKKPAGRVGGHVDRLAERDELSRSLRPRHEAGTMNGMEKAYAAYLETRRLSGEILDWKFEAMKLKLAKGTFYNPDFLVVNPDGRLELHETKGWLEDDAAVKVKVAAEMFPMFRFVIVKREGKGQHQRWSFKNTAQREIAE